VLNYEYPPIGGGGGSVCKDLAEELVRLGHEVRVQTSWIKGLPAVEHRGNLTVYRSYSFRKHADTCTVFQMFLYLITNFWPALRHTLFWKPDLIHAHFAVPTGVLARVINFFTGKPYVLTIHLGDVPGALPDQTDRLFKYIKPWTRPIWNGAAEIVAVSEFVRNLGEKAYGRKILKIFNGIHDPDPGQGERKQKPIRLLSVGRFNPQKNLSFLLEVLAGLKSDNWECTLIGDGPLREDLEKCARDLTCSDRIHFTGWLKQTEVDRHMAESHVFLMPSIAEGLPMAGISALFASLPIFGSRIDGLSDLIDQGENGYLLPLDEPEFWAQKLDEAIASPSILEAMGRQSLLKSQHFRISTVAEQYETLFREVLKNV